MMYCTLYSYSTRVFMWIAQEKDEKVEQLELQIRRLEGELANAGQSQHALEASFSSYEI